MPRLENQVAGFGVDGDAGKAGEKAVAEEAGFAVEDGALVQAGRDVAKFLGTELDGGLGLGNRKFGEADSRKATAICEADSGGDPLQGGEAAGVQADPLGFVAVDDDRDAHSAGAKLEGQHNGGGRRRLVRKEPNFLGIKIDLDDAVAEEVGS